MGRLDDIRDAVEDIEFYERQRFEREREREWAERVRRGDIPTITYRRGGPLSDHPELEQLRYLTTGWHFLPVANWLALLLSTLVERTDLDGRVVVAAIAVVGALNVVLFLGVVRHHGIPLRLAVQRRCGWRLSAEQRLRSWTLRQLLLVPSRAIAWVTLGAGLWLMFQGTGIGGGIWSWIIALFATALAALAVTPLFNGMWHFRSIMSSKTDREKDGY